MNLCVFFPTGISSGLVNIGGIPIINYWLLSLKNCSRLLPVKDKVCTWPCMQGAHGMCNASPAHKLRPCPCSQVFIVTSPETHSDYVAWAQDKEVSSSFPEHNILCTGVSQPPGTPSNALQDLTFALQAEPSLMTGYMAVGR